MSNAYRKIEPSLQKKIYQNDEKLKCLFNKETIPIPINNFESNENNSLQEQEIDEDNNQEIEQDEEINNSNIPTEKYEDSNQKESEQDLHNIITKIKKRIKFKKDKEEKKNNTIYFNQINNNSINNKTSNQKMKKFKTNNVNDEVFNRLYNNKYNHFKMNKRINYFNRIKENFANGKNSNKKKLKSASSVSKRNPNNLKNFLQNSEKWDEKRKNKIEKMKKEKEEKIENEFNYIPKIDENSVKIAEKNNLRKKYPNTFKRLAQQDEIIKEKKKNFNRYVHPYV